MNTNVRILLSFLSAGSIGEGAIGASYTSEGTLRVGSAGKEPSDVVSSELEPLDQFPPV